jgi:hypothetical protein
MRNLIYITLLASRTNNCGQGEDLSKILSFYRFGSTAISVIIMLYKQLRQVFDEVEDDSRNGHVVS